MDAARTDIKQVDKKFSWLTEFKKVNNFVSQIP
jgi:hypothetical protein